MRDDFYGWRMGQYVSSARLHYKKTWQIEMENKQRESRKKEMKESSADSGRPIATYWIIHEGFDASNICIMKAAMGRKLVHRAEGTQQRRQSVQLDETLDKRVGLRPKRRLEAVDQFGPNPHFFSVIFRECQLGQTRKKNTYYQMKFMWKLPASRGRDCRRIFNALVRFLVASIPGQWCWLWRCSVPVD